MEKNYLHGYSEQEAERLKQQSVFLEAFVYDGIAIKQDALILEPGCGVGGQTAVLLKRFPGVKIHAVETEARSVQKAKENLHQALLENKVEIFHSDLNNYKSNQLYDTVFICWVLEHVENPVAFLSRCFDLLKPGGQIIITEVFNDSLFLSPAFPAIQKFWHLFNECQLKNKGNPNAGAYVGNWLKQAGFNQIVPSAKTHFYDASSPDQRNRMLNYWFDLLHSAADQLLSDKFISEQDLLDFKNQWQSYSQHPEAIFLYSFFRYIAIK